MWTSVSPGGACVVLNFNDNALFTKLIKGKRFQWAILLTGKIFYISNLKQPGLAPSNAEHVLSKLRFRCKQMSACRHSGNPLSTEFMSMPFVYVQACWKYSSNLCRNGFGIYFNENFKVSMMELFKNCCCLLKYDKVDVLCLFILFVILHSNTSICLDDKNVKVLWNWNTCMEKFHLHTWWKRINSLTRSICVWYLAVPEYNLCIIADTLPNILAYISATKEKKCQFSNSMIANTYWMICLTMYFL